MPHKGTAPNPVPGRNPYRFREIPEYPVGSRWNDRRDLSDSGVHAPLTAGIHGRGAEGAFSVVLSGGYADDVDAGEEFTYTGQGGQAPREQGEKWDNTQIKDQEWKLGNLALKTSWRERKPIRVIRGSRLKSTYAPVAGYRYDGLYTVEEATMKPGVNGFQVCLFRFQRCPDQLPLPGSTSVTRPLGPERPYTFTSSTQTNRATSLKKGTSSEGDDDPYARHQRLLDSQPVASSSRHPVPKSHMRLESSSVSHAAARPVPHQTLACKLEEPESVHLSVPTADKSYKGKARARDDTPGSDREMYHNKECSDEDELKSDEEMGDDQEVSKNSNQVSYSDKILSDGRNIGDSLTEITVSGEHNSLDKMITD